MKDVRIVRAPEFVGTRLRNASGGQGTLARSPKAYWVKSRMGLDGEDMSFDELAEAMITTDKTLGVSKENRRARAKSLRHFSLAVRGDVSVDGLLWICPVKFSVDGYVYVL